MIVKLDSFQSVKQSTGCLALAFFHLTENLHDKQVFAKLQNQFCLHFCTHTYMQLMPEWDEKVLGGNFSCMVNEVLPSSLHVLFPSSTPTAASLGIFYDIILSV